MKTTKSTKFSTTVNNLKYSLYTCIYVCMYVESQSLSCVHFFATLWTVAARLLCPLGFSRQEDQSGLPFPSPGDRPHPGIKPGSPALQADSLPSEPSGKPIYICIGFLNIYTHTHTHIYIYSDAKIRSRFLTSWMYFIIVIGWNILNSCYYCHML